MPALSQFFKFILDEYLLDTERYEEPVLYLAPRNGD